MSSVTDAQGHLLSRVTEVERDDDFAYRIRDEDRDRSRTVYLLEEAGLVVLNMNGTVGITPEGFAALLRWRERQHNVERRMR